MAREPLVLVVDDSMLIRHSVCRWLEERGLQVMAAANAEEALQTLEHTRPDLIVTDMEMPGLGGAGLIARLRQSGLTSKIPVVVLTGCRQAAQHASTHAMVSHTVIKDIALEPQLNQALNELLSDPIPEAV